jgi:disulfide bond formation protein DsbB
MIRNPKFVPIGLAVLSAVTLASVYASQYWGGLQPCPLCLYQRWPWWIALALAVLAFWPAFRRVILVLAGLIVWAGAGIALYHVGIEQQWWAGPTSCSGAATPGSLDALRAQIFAAPIIRCDDIAWSLFGISMAGYNALVSLATGAGVIWLTRRKETPQ